MTITSERRGSEVIITGARDWDQAEQAAHVLLAPGEDLDAEHARVNLETNVRYFKLKN